MNQRISDIGILKRLASLDEGLAGSTIQTWNECEPLLRHAAATHPFHTSHGPDHAVALLSIVSQALDPLNTIMSAAELYILVCATMLHDIGMVGEPRPEEATRDKIRRNHHALSAQYIRQNWRALSIRYEYVQAVADVARAHRKVNISKDIQERPIGVTANVIPRTRLCAAVLRFADELHITFDRVPHDYASLSLPEESLKHFIAHELTTGRAFNSTAGTVVFSVTVNDSNISVFIDELHKKIQAEIDEISTILRQNGIPYARVVFMQTRNALVRRKVIRYLLQNATGTIEAIAAEVDESAADVETFLRIEAGPTISNPAEAGDTTTFSLSVDTQVFEAIAKEFIIDANDKQDPFHFIESDLCHRILDRGFAGALLAQCISAPDTLSLFTRVVRKSPSALRYILQNRERLPRARVDGASGVVQSLVGELLNDYYAYPSLLLDPELPDKLHDCGIIDRRTFERTKIRQIAEYHRAFPSDQIIEQWAVPNKWEVSAAKLDSKATKKFNVQMQLPADEPTNPFMLFAAASRLGYEFSFEGTPKFPLKFTVDDPEIRTDYANSSYQRLTINREHAEHLIQGTMECSFVSLGRNEYLIAVEIPAKKERQSWNYPICVRINAISEHSNAPRPVEVEYTVGVLPDMLDCKSASLLMKAGSTKKSKVFIGSRTDKRARMGPLPEELKPLLTMNLSQAMRALVSKLAKLQTKLGTHLAFPYAGMPSSASAVLEGAEVRSKKEARDLWQKIQESFAAKPKPAITPVGLEVWSNSSVIERHYIDFYYGARQPRLTISSPASDALQANLDAALENMQSPFQIRLPCRLSPLACLRYIQDTPVAVGDSQKSTPFVLNNFKARGVAEHHTLVVYEWQKSHQSTWYIVTPLVCKCVALTPVERLQIEARHLSSEQKDHVRAYLATKEAHRMSNGSVETAISLGWQAFLLGRLDECISITEKAEQTSEPSAKFTAKINLGLAHLACARNDEQSNEEHTAKAKQYYDSAIDMVSEFSQKEAVLHIEEATNDIDAFRDRLPDEADEIRSRFVERIPPVSEDKNH